MKKAILNGKIVLPDRVVFGGALVFDEKIEALENANEQLCGTEVIDAGGGYILPGFVDIHVHGGGGGDFLDYSSGAVEKITSLHAFHGTTSLLATTLTCDDETLFHGIRQVLSAMEKGTAGAEILGLHLEGPYFSAGNKGAQAVNSERIPTADDISRIITECRGRVLRIDAAPELENIDILTEAAVKHGILLSVGHSSCNAECALSAFKKGYTHITHLYCATTTEHKEGQTVHGGIIEAAYLEDGFTVELIADGHHIPRETMLLAFKIKGAKKIALITDAMRAAGTDSTSSVLGSDKNGTPVIIEDGVAKLCDRSSFAGSVATMDTALKTALRYGVPLLDAVRSVSLTPAGIIGVSDRKGSLEVGKDADIVICDSDMNVKNVFIKGKNFR